MSGNELIDPIAISHDPYSEVSLFLARKIKEFGSTTFGSTSWTRTLQDRLLEKITPEFGKKFPQYRLGAAAVKKTWEKVSHLSQLFERRGGALTSSGALNLHFLIRENLKATLAQCKNSPSHPFLLAQQLAVKVGESLASYEGVRPQLEQLTELIWTALKHLLPLPETPHKEIKDRLIAKWVVDALTKQPGMPYNELQAFLHEKRNLYKTVSARPSIHALCIKWATALAPHTTFVQTESSENIRKLKAWIKSFLQEPSKSPEELIQDIKTASLKLRYYISLHDLEILSWSCLVESETALFPELEQEALTHLIHHPQEHWKTAISRAAHLIKKAAEITHLGVQSEWNHRIELWSCQGELALATIELPETPLLHLARSLHHNNCPLTETSTTAKLREYYLHHYTLPLIPPSMIHQAADMMRKYAWYRLKSATEEPTIDRWAALYDTLPREVLREKAEKEFPFLPIKLL